MIRTRTYFAGGPGGAGVNTLHFSGSDAQAANEAAQTTLGFWTDVRDLIVNDITITVDPVVEAVDETDGELTDQFTIAGGLVTGGSGNDPLPWATQGLVNLTTAELRGGRRVRGRIFLPGMNISINAGGAPSSGARAQIDTAMVQLLQGEGSNGLVVWSKPRTLGPLPAVPGQASLVTGAKTSLEWAVLRSRRD